MMRRKTVPRRSLAACLAAAVLADISHKAPAADSTCPVDEHGAPCSSWSARVDAVDLPLVRKVDATISYPTGDPSFAVMEAFSGEQTLPAEFVSPFLLAHDFGTPTKDLNKPGPAHDHGPAVTPGARTTGWHPHRGFDILTYMKEGRGSHADSLGNVAVVRPGGIQWMRTGSGIEHAEGGGNPEGINKHGFQIWVNLNSSMKMASPLYGAVQPEDVPEARAPGGGVSRFIAGRRGAGLRDRDDISIIDCELPSGGNHTVVIDRDLLDRVLVYAYQGGGTVSGTAIKPRQTAVLEAPAGLDRRGAVQLVAGSAEGFGVLVFAGRGINEPISWGGPIVMNTRSEIDTAFRELQHTGNFYKTRANFDYHAFADASPVPYQK